MSKTILTIPLVLATAVLFVGEAAARTWTDATGKHSVDAELVDFDDEVVVLKKAGGKLTTVYIDRLSKEDRAYLQGKEAAEIHKGPPAATRQWTLRDGTTFRAEVVDFVRRDCVLARRQSAIFLGERRLSEQSEIQQKIVLEIVATELDRQVEDMDALNLAVAQLPEARLEFLCEGVLFETVDKEQLAAPFFVLSEKDREFLRPGWESWLEANTMEQTTSERETMRELASLLLRARARLTQEERALNMAANRLVVEDAFGYSRWRVTLTPRPGTAGYPMRVVVSGRTSAEAQFTAQQQYPGYIVGGASKLSRRW